MPTAAKLKDSIARFTPPQEVRAKKPKQHVMQTRFAPSEVVRAKARKQVRHHLDRRAHTLTGEDADEDDDLLSTRELCDWLTVSYQWVTMGRSEGYGPPFIQLTPAKVVYRRGDVRAWLRERTYSSTAEYPR